MVNKLIKKSEIQQFIHKGDTILIGGFSNVGCPLHLLYELAKYPEINELTTISEDFGYCDLNFIQGPEMLLKNNQIKKIIVSFLGHTAAEQAYLNGDIDLELIPQGTMAERLRCAGAGLGGFYTPTGVGTEVEFGKETKIINGKKYLLELPLRGNVALIKAYKADMMGNAMFKLTANNFNTCMAMAADTVILETENIVNPGDLEPDMITLPGIFVDYIVYESRAMF